jgi:hypothetical protein
MWLVAGRGFEMTGWMIFRRKISAAVGIARAFATGRIMNANPFQVPVCFQIELERRRRTRFKRTVLAIVAGIVMLLVGLLIEGCVSEHAKAATPHANTANL